MNLSSFIKLNNLRPADAVIVRKGVGGLLAHYAIYLGTDQYGEHLFIANMRREGVVLLRERRVSEFLRKYVPTGIRRFERSEDERREAVRRALNSQDQNSYDLFFNNCEHFANRIQHNQNYSLQARNAGLGLAALLGFGLLIGGMAAAGNDEDDGDDWT